VAATIEYERPDRVRLKLSSKASVVPFEERAWSGWLGEDMMSVKKRRRKVCVEVVSKTGYGLNHLLLRFSV